MDTAYLFAGVRTPFGRYGGALAPVRPDGLAAHVLRALTAELPSVDWAELDGVVLGCANQAGEDNRGAARMAVLLAELPDLHAGHDRQPAVRFRPGHGGHCRPRGPFRRCRPGHHGQGIGVGRGSAALLEAA